MVLAEFPESSDRSVRYRQEVTYANRGYIEIQLSCFEAAIASLERSSEIVSVLVAEQPDNRDYENLSNKNQRLLKTAKTRLESQSPQS